MIRTFLRPLLSILLVLSTAEVTLAQTTHHVTQMGVTFSPKDITIDAGDTVVWHWTNFDHTVTEGLAPPQTGAEAFDELLDAAHPTVTVVFDAAFLAANPRPGNLYDYYCLFHFGFGMVGSITVIDDPFTDLGGGLAGVAGIPQLSGTGSLVGGTNATIELAQAAPSAFAVMFLSTANTPTPFRCGTLNTVPVLLSVTLVTSPAGEIVIPFSPWPAGLPSGVSIFWQYAVADGGAICGASISNLLESTLP